MNFLVNSDGLVICRVKCISYETHTGQMVAIK